MKKEINTNQYVTLITPDEVSGYNVVFPELPGCLTCGDTYEEAAENAKEVLSLWLEVMQERKEEVPKPSRFVPFLTFTTPVLA